MDPGTFGRFGREIEAGIPARIYLDIIAPAQAVSHLPVGKCFGQHVAYPQAADGESFVDSLYIYDFPVFHPDRVCDTALLDLICIDQIVIGGNDSRVCRARILKRRIQGQLCAGRAGKEKKDT